MSRKQSRQATNVAPRKLPSQSRSRSTVNRILSGAERLLAEHGAEALTTRKIGAASGVAVGSIYQYFPNKQVIVYTLYRERLTRIKEIFESFNRSQKLGKSWPLFFLELHQTIQRFAWFDVAGLELEKAVSSDAALQRTGREHLDELVGFYVGFFRHYGARWDDERLTLFANYLLSFDDWNSRQQLNQGAQEREALQRWSQRMRAEILAQCLGEERADSE